MKKAKAAREAKSYVRRRRMVGLVSLAVILALFVWITYFMTNYILGKVHTPEEFRAYIESFGWKSRFVFLGLQVLQVVVAMIPGEIVQVGGGYAFGPVEGTLLCMAGVVIASALIFLLTKRLGIRLVEAFVSREKIDELRFINSEKKLKRTIFILFFIPGSPKDLFTYFAGLTRIRLHEFLVISLIARVPGIIMSTVGGHMFGTENYRMGVLFFAAAGLVSLAGMGLYMQLVGRHKRKHKKTGGDAGTPEKEEAAPKPVPIQKKADG